MTLAVLFIYLFLRVFRVLPSLVKETLLSWLDYFVGKNIRRSWESPRYVFFWPCGMKETKKLLTMWSHRLNDWRVLLLEVCRLGLGLYIAKEFVFLIDFVYWVGSRLGRSTFLGFLFFGLCLLFPFAYILSLPV